MRSGFRWLHGSPDQLTRAYVGAADGQVDRVARAQYIETEIDAAEAKERTPVDTGTLRGTVHATGPSMENGQIVTAIVAGGPAAPYAVEVHENLDAFHKVGQAKYIESVTRESAPYMRVRILKRYRSLR